MSEEVTQPATNPFHESARRNELRINNLFKDYPNPRIQEREFCATFLPMFVGGGDYLNLDAWRAVAGNLVSEVDVFNGDEYLYTIPQVNMDVVGVISVRGDDGIPTHTLSGALHSLKDEPNDMRTYALIDSQVEQAEDMVTGSREELLARWDAIFKRYNIDYLEVRKQLAIARHGADAVKDYKIETSSKKHSAMLDEELVFHDGDDDIIESY